MSPTTREEQDEPIEEWIGGLELATILAGITLVCFLMLLDTSIISTVKGRLSHTMFTPC